MSAMLKSSLVNYPSEVACFVAVALLLLFVGLTFAVFRKRAKPGFDYASRLPLE